MAPPGAQPDLAADASPGPDGHTRNDSVATQATLVADVAQPGANAVGRALKDAADSDDLKVVDNQRCRVTAGTPSGPNAAAITANTGSSTAAAPMNIPSITAAALAVADTTNTITVGPNEGPSGVHAAGAGVTDFEDSSDDDFDYDQLDYDNVFSLPPGYELIPIPIGQTGPDDWVDQHGRAFRVVRVDDVPPVCAMQGVDEEDDWVLSGVAHDDSDNANDDKGNDDEDERVNVNGNNGDDDQEGGNDSDLASDWQPPAELPKGPDAAGTIGYKDVRTEENRERVAKETVALSKIAPTVPLPPNFVRVPLRPEPDNILRPPWWDEELEKHIAAPLAPPDDAPPAPRVNKRKRDDDDEEEDEPAPRAPKKARRGKPLDIDELCARLAVIAWIIDVYGTCARLTDGRRDLFAGANADDAEADAGVDADGQHNSENGGKAGAADEYDEDADWVLQALLYERSVPCFASMSVR